MTSRFDSETDIDIDLANRAEALAGLVCVPAVEKVNRRRHSSGVYFQEIPSDPLDHMAAWDHEEAKARGFLKIDLLPNHIYKQVRSEKHLVELLTRDPPWHLFQDREVVSKLVHVANHYNVVNQIRPCSIVDLAVCIALVRPGKRHLIGRPRHEIDAEIWTASTDGYYFKKSHAIAYAAAIVVQLNALLDQGSC